MVSRSLLSRDRRHRQGLPIMNGNMKTRVPLRGTGDELDRLSETINAMLDRIAGLMENVRQVTNDIAHDLRTPVTHLRHRLEHARLHAAAPADYDKALGSGHRCIRRYPDVVLPPCCALPRSKAAPAARGFAAVQLADLLQQLRDMFGPVADDAGHVLTLTPVQPATIRG